MIDIPPEILLLIAEHLHPKDRLQVLLVCRDWYNILLSQAYEGLLLKQIDEIYPFALAIQKNPRIGPAVRTVYFQWQSYDWYYNENPLPEYDWKPFQEIVKQASPTDEHRAKWEEALGKGCADAWLAVIAPYLVNATTMTITYDGCSDYFFYMVARATTCAAPFNSQPGLRRLESVSVCKDRDASKAPAYFASEFLPFAYLPAMSRMAFETLGEEDNYRSQWTFSKPAGTTNIKELTFDKSNGTYGFNDLIASCAALESLYYHHEDFVEWGGQTWDFHPYEFYKSLITQKHSLQVLHLQNNGNYHYMGDRGNDMEHFPEYKRFGSLREFSQLRDLRIPLKTLLQYGMTETPSVSLEDVLPASLEHLTIAHYGEEYFDAISEGLRCMASQRERFPNLKRVEIKPLIMWRNPDCSGWNSRRNLFIVPQWFHDQFVSIKMLFEERGIEFEIIQELNHFQPFRDQMRSTLNDIFQIR